ncbi:MAG: hypothetical protein ABEJ95_01720 [Candidatus Nanohalobium sp.]
MPYQPGERNIGELERKKMVAAGSASFTNSIILMVVVAVFPRLWPLHAAILLLNFTGFLSIFQYFNSFSIRLALKKKFMSSGEVGRVDKPCEVSKDRRKALIMIFKALTAALLSTLLVYVLTG